MGKKEKVDVLIEGGKATAAPPIGSALGPLKVDIAGIVNKINEKTKEFKGMKIPVKIIVDTSTKEYEIEIGTPSVAELLKKEIGIEKGSFESGRTPAGAISLEGVIKIAKMKGDGIYANSFKNAVKTVLGSCVSMGVIVDEKSPKEILKEITKGLHDNTISKEITEASPDKKIQIEKLNKELQNKQKDMKKQKEDKAAEAAAATAAAPATEGKPEEKKAVEMKKAPEVKK